MQQTQSKWSKIKDKAKQINIKEKLLPKQNPADVSIYDNEEIV